MTRCAARRACAALVVLAVSPGAAGAAPPGATLGVYAGAGKPSAVAAFESNIGRPVASVHEALARENWVNLSNPLWFAEQWNASSYRQRVMYSVPMLPDSGGTLAEGARGAYNEHFRLLALRLVASGEGSATLRIGPEFNGNWFRWTIAVPNGAADYAAFWRQIVTTMRSVPGAAFKFDWCANGGSSWVGGQQLQAAAAYPGDAYVDYIGLDVYDQSWSPNRHDPAARWNEFVNTRNGLAWQKRFAAAHGKAMTFPEWGLSKRADGYGGGDNPYFIEQMHDWIAANNVAYHMYFEHGDGNGDYALFSGWAPKAAVRFIELFSASRKRRKRCVGRALRVRGKVVRRDGRIVRRLICARPRPGSGVVTAASYGRSR